ncbi:MAG TPA: hypothetical protein DDY71_16515 [Spirochaetia bacterium]|nr:MAG: hypothetical protein A2Y29_01495 [Spirochaetes bacterium GWE2_31_10]HBD94637.1 hypothetical protein [Spirochaetia bacterium]HBI39247.1 hypothetical protein [Spirochaetia bacterium]
MKYKLLFLVLILSMLLLSCSKDSGFMQFKYNTLLMSELMPNETLTNEQLNDLSTFEKFKYYISSFQSYKKMDLLTNYSTHITYGSGLDHKIRRDVINTIHTRLLRYAFSISGSFGDMLIFQDSGSVNFFYNLNYLISLPKNLIKNISFDLAIMGFNSNNKFWNKIAKEETKVSISGSFVGPIAGIFFIIGDIILACFGVITSIIMLIVGTLLGTLFHPIRTFLDFFPCIFAFLGNIVYSLPWGIITLFALYLIGKYSNNETPIPATTELNKEETQTEIPAQE